MRAEVGEFYHIDPTGLSGRRLAELHAQIPAMHAVRQLRENWGDLTVEGVERYGQIAHGKGTGFVLARQKLAEKQVRSLRD